MVQRSKCFRNGDTDEERIKYLLKPKEIDVANSRKIIRFFRHFLICEKKEGNKLGFSRNKEKKKQIFLKDKRKKRKRAEIKCLI